MWNAANVPLREQFIALNAYIRKKERSQIRDLSSYLKKIGEKEENKPK